jgi:hypothetical protein
VDGLEEGQRGGVGASSARLFLLLLAGLSFAWARRRRRKIVGFLAFLDGWILTEIQFFSCGR